MVGDESKQYKISFVLDRHPMFSVWSTRHGKPFKHEVKVSDPVSLGAASSLLTGPRRR